MTRFALVVGSVLGALVLGIALLLLRGDRADLAPIAVAPAGGATDVSTRPTITVTYRWPLEEGSASAAFRIDPPVEGDLEVAGATIHFTPRRPLAAGASYTLSLGAGVREVGGRTSRQPVASTFRTRGPRLLVLTQDGRPAGLDLVDPTTGTARRLTGADETVGAAAVSPDGEEVAYVARDGLTRWSLRVVRADGTDRRTIVPDETGVVATLAWSPRGDLIAYEHQDTLGKGFANPRLWVVRPDGSERALVYGRGDEMGSMPVWSPDGRQLAFYEARFRAVAVFDFTSSLRMILAEAGFPPSWSPDGAFLAVGNRTGPALGRGMVQIADVAEGDATRRPLAEGTGSDQAPAWSPTGEWIAFTRLGGDGNGVWVARPDGSEAHPLHEAANGAYLPLAWQPDGSAVAFTRLQGRPGAPEPEREVWLAPLSGTPRRLGVRGAVLAWVP